MPLARIPSTLPAIALTLASPGLLGCVPAIQSQPPPRADGFSAAADQSALERYVVFTKSVVIGGGGPWEAGDGDLLVLDESGSKPEGFGFVRAGTAFNVVGRFSDELVQAHFDLDGKMEVWALVKQEMLGRFTLRPQSIADTSLFVAEGSLVRVLSLGSDSTAEIEGTVWLPSGTALLADTGEFSDGLWRARGTLPTDNLSTNAPSDVPEPGKVGTTLPGKTFELFDRPGGKATWKIAGEEWGLVVWRLETQDDWARILVGRGPGLDGPFLVGWTQTPVDTEPSLGGLGVRAQGPLGALSRGEGKLWEVPAGTILQRFGQRLALLHAPGWAREIQRSDDGTFVWVKLTVNGEATLYGWVPAAGLTPGCITQDGYPCEESRD